MVKPRTHIDVKISLESLRASLYAKISSQHSRLIVDMIIGNLEETEVGLEQLYKAMNGIEDKLKYKVGDHVRVIMKELYVWNFNENATIEAGMVHQGRIKAQIISINLYKLKPYGIKYTAMGSSDTTKELTGEVAETIICLEEEWPEIAAQEEKDTPF